MQNSICNLSEDERFVSSRIFGWMKEICKYGTDVDFTATWIGSPGQRYVRIASQGQYWIMSPAEYQLLLSHLSYSMQGSSPINSQNHNLFSPPKKQDHSYSGRLVDGQIGRLESLIPTRSHVGWKF